MLHSPRMTRSQTAAVLGAETEARQLTSATQGEDVTEALTLQAVMRELQQLREEIGAGQRSQGGPGGECGNQGQCLFNLKLKPDVYDGNSPFYEYVAQFELIAKANKWTVKEKALIFAANLRGKARMFLEEMGEDFSYEELKSKLELRFGERVGFQDYYSQLINKKIKIEEDFATFGGEIERLVRLAYPECIHELRDKIACAQFIAGLSKGIVKQTLQLEGIVSLRVAIERAKVVSTITERENTSLEQRFRERGNFGGNNFYKTERIVNYGQGSRGEFARNSQRNPRGSRQILQEVREQNIRRERIGKGGQKKECWQCGGEGHFRAECPSLVNRQLN